MFVACVRILLFIFVLSPTKSVIYFSISIIDFKYLIISKIDELVPLEIQFFFCPLDRTAEMQRKFHNLRMNAKFSFCNLVFERDGRNRIKCLL